jgi:hypothetical protein
MAACVFVAGHAGWSQGYSVVGGGGSRPRSAPAGGGTVTVSPPAGIPRGSMRVTPSASDDPRHPWDYGGVVPGNGVLPPGLSQRDLRRARGRTVVAWPGFQLTPDGSRIFLAMVPAVPANVLAMRPSGRLVYRLRNAVVPVRNNRRALETAVFNTPVARAYLRQRGRDVDLVLELRGQADPRISQRAAPNGLGFLYLDFAPWRAGGVTPVDPGRPGLSDTAAPQDADTERPPPVQLGP